MEMIITLAVASIAGSATASGVARLLYTTMGVGKHPVKKTKKNHDIPDEEVEVK